MDSPGTSPTGRDGGLLLARPDKYKKLRVHIPSPHAQEPIIIAAEWHTRAKEHGAEEKKDQSNRKRSTAAATAAVPTGAEENIVITPDLIQLWLNTADSNATAAQNLGTYA